MEYCGDGKYKWCVTIKEAFVKLEKINMWTQVITTQSAQYSPPGQPLSNCWVDRLAPTHETAALHGLHNCGCDVPEIGH